MALVGHISGSNQSNSVIGISGSVIIASKPNATFPSLDSGINFLVDEASLFKSTLVSSGSVTVKGSSGSPTFSVTATSGNTVVGGTLNVVGATTLASIGVTGNTTVGGNLTVTGDLTVNGAMNTINTTNLEVKDSVIGLGFASGTIAQTNGDRGWIGGLATGGTNVMSKWDNANSEFAFATTTSSATGSFAISNYSNLHANNIQGNIVSASLGFSGSLTTLMDGTSYLIAGSNVTITSASNGAVTISSTGGGGGGAPTNAQYLVLSADGTLTDERVFAVGTGLSATDGGAGNNYTLGINDSVVATISGSTFVGGVQVVANFGVTGSAGFNGAVTLGDASGDAISVLGTMTVTPNATFSGDIKVNGNDITTDTAAAATVFNANATSLNMGGAATTMLVGATNVAMAVGGVASPASTITAATGSFGRVLASSTSTFTGQTTHNGGISTTTLLASSDATILGTLGVSQSITGSSTLTLSGQAILNGGIISDSGAFQVADTTGNISTAGTLNVNQSITGSSTLTLTGTALLNGGTQTTTLGVSSTATFNGDVDLGNAITDTVSFTARVDTSVLPLVDNAVDLGSATQRWANVYTGDLHLKNDRGDYTLIEEEDMLTIRFNKTGKRYKFLLEAVPELDESPVLKF